MIRPMSGRWIFLTAILLGSCIKDETGPSSGNDATSYGQWEVLAHGEPAFVYTGPVESPQSTTQDVPSIPMHLFGNDVWSAFGDASGRIAFFLRTGGPMWVGRPLLGRPGSGWGLLETGGATVPVRRDTAMRPGRIIFTSRSISYLDKASGRDIQQSIEFKDGNSLAAVKRVVINPGGNGDAVWWDVWDLTPHPILIAPIYGGDFSGGMDQARDDFNSRYRFKIRHSGSKELILEISPITQEAAVPPAEFGPYPRELKLSASEDFLEARLMEEPYLDPRSGSEIGPTPLGVEGPLTLAMAFPASGSEPRNLEIELTVTPAEGTEPAAVGFIPNPDTLSFSGAEVPEWLTREMRWHAGQLAAHAAYDGAFQSRIVDQGSAYLYLQGASGAVRDLVLHALALIPTRPDLARDNLSVAMRWTKQDGHIYYASSGFGHLTDVAIRDESTDLDLFLLWGLTRYVLETRDFAFLDTPVPFGDGGQGAVRDRVELALRHLIHTTGTGGNGWIRVGTGDWSDGIVLFSANPGLTRQKGESFFNTAMALTVLPNTLAWIASWNSALAQEGSEWLDALREAALQGKRDRWYARGSFGDGGYLGEDRPFLESNLFALWAGLGSREDQSALVAALTEILDDPEPLGARNVFPSNEEAGKFLEPGWDVNGGTWPALNGLYAAALGGLDPTAAWRVFIENTLHRHTEVYPSIWYGIWTGPDSYNAAYAERPGETFVHIATPMTDFPAANMNVHSGPLLALDYLIGIRPEPEGIRLDSSLMFRTWTYSNSLLSVKRQPNRIDLDFFGTAAPDDLWILDVPAGWKGACRADGTFIAPAGETLRVPLGPISLIRCSQP